jgi:hypothetical protein
MVQYDSHLIEFQYHYPSKKKSSSFLFTAADQPTVELHVLQAEQWLLTTKLLIV